jgi:hypothetical protein
MKNSISEVLETMFYLPVEFKENLAPEEISLIKKDIKTGCRLNVSGSFPATFQLFIPDPLLIEMTQNFMGELKENCTKEYLYGTLKEALNMIVGNTLRAMKTKTPPELDIPEIINNSDMESGSLIIIETIKGIMAMQILMK